MASLFGAIVECSILPLDYTGRAWLVGSMRFFIPLFFACSLHALDRAAIMEIAGQPHDRSDILAELAIYPDAREYKVSAQGGPVGGDLVAMPSPRVKEKIVRGRYVVSEVKFPNQEKPMIMVVTFDKEQKSFKKWILAPGVDKVIECTGIGDLKKRTIAWMNEGPLEGETTLSIESQSDEESRWKEVTYKEGKAVRILRGRALKIK